MVGKLNFKDYVFLLIALVLYVLFIFFPNNVPVVQLEYFGIILCLVYSFFIKGHFLDTWLVRTALCFTVLADFFLLVLGNYELVGVVFFIVVQLIYGIRLMQISKDSTRNRYQEIFIRLLLILIFQWILISYIKSDKVLLMATLFYIANLIANVIIGIKNFKCNQMFTTGLVLFLCCDLFVGLYNSHHYINRLSHPVLNELIQFPIDLMWFFYYPSQVLITLSIGTATVSAHTIERSDSDLKTIANKK